MEENLVNADFGILCVAKGAWDSSWFSFEAGGLSVSTYDEKGKHSHVVPLLFNLFNDENGAINPHNRPLAHVQNISFGEDGLNDLFCGIDRQVRPLVKRIGEVLPQRDDTIGKWVREKFPDWSQSLFYDMFREIFQESFIKDAKGFCDFCKPTEINKISSLTCPLAHIAEAERLEKEVKEALTIIGESQNMSPDIDKMRSELRNFRGILMQNHQRSLRNQESARNYAARLTEQPKEKPEKFPLSFLRKKDKELPVPPEKPDTMKQATNLDDDALKLCDNCLTKLENLPQDAAEREKGSIIREANIEILKNRLERYSYLVLEAQYMLQDDQYEDKLVCGRDWEKYHNSQEQLLRRVRNLSIEALLLEQLARALLNGA